MVRVEQQRRSRNRLQHAQAIARSAAAACEPLETRRLLSTINWTNKGSGIGDDTDSFNAIYGANATVARNIVQRAIDDWERVIVDFNYQGGGNTYTININAAPINGRGVTGGVDNFFGKPIGADITLDDDGGGNGWYFDPTVGSSTLPDDSEFTTLLSPFNATFNGAGGANDDDDFYRTSAHELGHALGISGTNALFLDDNFTDVGDDPNSSDPTDRIFAWNINGGAVEATFTNNTGIHFYEGPTVVGASTIHPGELLNPGRTVEAPPTQRQLISDLTATVLRDAYAYTIALPSTINTFHANLNTATGRLTINDSAGNVNDTVSLNASGLNLITSVAGTSETIANSNINSIVLGATGGNDNIFINDLPALDARATLNGGAGNDTFHIGGGDLDNNIDDFIEINGDSGADRVEFEDTSDTLDDSYLLGSLFFSKDSSTFNTILNTVEGVQIEASNTGNNTLSVTGVAAGRPVTLLGQGGNDTFNLGSLSNLDATLTDDVSVNGGAGDDSLVADDSAETASHNYSGSTSGIGRSGSTGGITYTAVEDVTLNAGTNNDTGQFGGVLSGVTLRVNGGNGNDLFEIGQDLDTNFNGTFVGSGGGGTDTVRLDDTADTLDDTYTISGTSLTKSPDPVTISYGTFERIELEASERNNTINFFSVSSTQTLVLNGFGGGDTFINNVQDLNNSIAGDVSIIGGAGVDTVSLNDSGDATADAYTLTSNSFQVTAGLLSGLINYSTIETFTAITNDQSTPINVTSALSTVDYTLNGGDGNDTFNIGGGDFDNIDSVVSVSGGAGIDRVRIDDLNDTGVDTYNLNAASFSKTTGTGGVNWAGLLLGSVTIEQFVLDASNENSTINVNGLGGIIFTVPPDPPIVSPINATLNGNGGVDTINIAAANNVVSALRGNISVNGGAGVDSLVIDDSNDTGADTYDTNIGIFTKSDWDFTLITFQHDNLLLQANDENNNINITDPNGADVIRGGAGADNIRVEGTFGAVPCIVDGQAGLDSVNVDLDGAGTTSVAFTNSQDLQIINIGAGGLVSMGLGGILLDTVGVSIGGRLDMGNGGMIDRALSIEATIRTLLTNGHAGGAWNGAEPSIFSSAAATPALNDGVGYAFANQTGLASFFGVAVAANDMLLRYTLNGDNTLDGTVDISDFALTAANFNVANTNWVRGNYNYDLITDIGDFANLAANFNQSVPADLPRVGGINSPFSRTTIANDNSGIVEEIGELTNVPDAAL